MNTTKEKKSYLRICCVIFWPILKDDKRNEKEDSVSHFVVPTFGRNLELAMDNFIELVRATMIDTSQ